MKKLATASLFILLTASAAGNSSATPLVLVDTFTLPYPFGTPASWSPAVGLAASSDHLFVTEAYLDRPLYGDMFVVNAKTGVLENQFDMPFLGEYPPGLDGLALLGNEVYGLLSGPVPTVYVLNSTNGNLIRWFHPVVGTLWNALDGCGSRLFSTDGGLIYELDPGMGAPLNAFNPGVPPPFGLAYSDSPLMGLFVGSLFSGDLIWQLDPNNGMIQDMFSLTELGAVGPGVISAMAAHGQDLYVLDDMNQVFHLAPIPEPSTILFFVAGLVGFALVRKFS